MIASLNFFLISNATKYKYIILRNFLFQIYLIIYARGWKSFCTC